MDKLLEEVDEQQANALRTAEQDVIYREESLKNMREEVEKERRGQDALLREMRIIANNAEISAAAGAAANVSSAGNMGNGSPGPSGIGHSFSNTNMQQVYNTGNRSLAGRSSKR